MHHRFGDNVQYFSHISGTLRYYYKVGLSSNDFRALLLFPGAFENRADEGAGEVARELVVGDVLLAGEGCPSARPGVALLEAVAFELEEFLPVLVLADIWGHNTYIKKCFIHHGIQQLIILLKSSLHWNRILMRAENGNAQRQTE